MSARDRLAGKTFGRWTVIADSRMPNGDLGWICRCACGAERTIVGHSLKSGDSRSCGCWQKDWASANGKKAKTHGMTGKPTHASWRSMIERCTKNDHVSWPRYGGRGIRVCQRWMKFEHFLEDMGARPDGMTLDRVDTNGDYCKSNCRWATIDQQSNNRETNVILEAFGERKTAMQWSRDPRCMVTHNTLCQRIAYGVDPLKAIVTPSAHANYKKRTVSA